MQQILSVWNTMCEFHASMPATIKPTLLVVFKTDFNNFGYRSCNTLN